MGGGRACALTPANFSIFVLIVVGTTERQMCPPSRGWGEEKCSTSWVSGTWHTVLVQVAWSPLDTNLENAMSFPRGQRVNDSMEAEACTLQVDEAYKRV